MIDHTAELIDELEAARPALTKGQYEAKRLELDQMIRRGDVIELSSGEAAVKLALTLGIVALPLGWLLLIYGIGGRGTPFVWIVAAVLAVLSGVGARYVRRHGVLG